ncbi:MAG: DNA recombination protein RmuC [Lachnospiraceae bacterium]|nr:DNA recombination protein RmuC [Lachnospiraceae bacterium]
MLTEMLLGVIIILLVLVIILLITRTSASAMDNAGARMSGKISDDVLRAQEKLMDSASDQLTDRVSLNVAEIRRDINQRLSHDSEENRRNRTEVSDMISRGQEKMDKSLRDALMSMQDANRKKLDEIQTDINKKLDMSLNERLDKSFKTVGDQLNKLYTSLGELSKLETGVNSLNKTLSNVKTRGIFGETQLENILSDILAPSLYDKNVVTKKSKSANRDAVEFAVKIPDKETAGEFMYLPIDSKFPASIYDKIRQASEASDPQALSAAVKELEIKVRQDAKDIQDKYLDPPYTTDFGIMFLPTESLYAEVLRIPGLVEECRSRYHVTITGPSTAAALINSLSIGFRYMAVNRDSQNILKLLSAIKSQYHKLSELIDKADSRIELAKKATDDLRQRTDIINKRLASVEEIDKDEAKKLLGFADEYGDE